ncbi:response regulator [Oxalobacteraceae bacterium]|nr:response regulator [Oxalobacteraceae bacterium]
MSDAPLRVLMVEDDVVDRMAARRAFAAGAAAVGAIELIEADSGAQGLQLAAALRPDCILLDYHLPDLSGLEFLARLASASGAAAPPVMMLTGADSAAVAAEAMRGGARDYLVKDVDGRYLEQLAGAIVRLLREQRLRDDKLQVEARFRTLVEQIQAISYIAELEPPQRLRYISPQIQVLGFTAEEWLADPGLHAARMDPAARASVEAAISLSRASRIPLRLEYRLQARDGGWLWLRDQAEVVSDEAGQAMFVQGILVDITRNKLAEQALQASQDALRRLAAHQENIKEQERKRIAQEIHDELGGLLTGIKAYISVAIERGAASGAPADPLLADAAALAQDAIQTVRRVITDLRPSVLDQLGVWAALEWYAGQIEQRSGLACHCRIAPQVAALELGPERSTMLFRVVQEALTNVVRHAQARNVRIEVLLEGAYLLLSVADDGQGIAAERLLNRDSWGIQGMHERSRHFAGELKLSGTPGQGTTLQLRLPLEENDEY